MAWAVDSLDCCGEAAAAVARDEAFFFCLIVVSFVGQSFPLLSFWCCIPAGSNGFNCLSRTGEVPDVLLLHHSINTHFLLPAFLF